ncbi:hypothetical protein [Massilia sp. DD77]|uniref:hypothetical protein n=1 Tax=Massilia sp. DD77 TaxID=3109349 RepID=UPI0030003AEF
MNTTIGLQLGLRTLALLALVAVSTTVLVKPDLIGGAGHGVTMALSSIPVVGHH